MDNLEEKKIESKRKVLAQDKGLLLDREET